MRACIIALSAIAFTSPALAATSHGHSHRNRVASLSHHHAAAHHRHARLRRVPMEAGYAYAMPQPFAGTNAFAPRAFGGPSFPNQSWQQTWAAPEAPFGGPAPRMRSARVHDGALDAMIARHAAANGLPVELVHRVVTRESGYNPRARSGGNLGLMQIKYATARGVGYTGAPSGLMDPETNLTYAVRYLAGAYHAAGGNPRRAVALYASGYHGRGSVPAAPTLVAAAPMFAHTTPE